MSIPKLLTKKEVCEVLRMSMGSLDTRIREGEIRGMIKDRGKVFFPESEILKYLARKTVKAS